MALEERLVDGDVLDADAALVAIHVVHAIDAAGTDSDAAAAS